MLDLVSEGSSWEEVVDLAVRIEAAGATIINTGIGTAYHITLICIPEEGRSGVVCLFFQQLIYSIPPCSLSSSLASSRLA